MCTGMAMTINVFISSGHSVSESQSKLPGQTCGPPRELVKEATSMAVLCHLGLHHSECLLTTDDY